MEVVFLLVLLPPSETKRPGGDGAAFDAGHGRFAMLATERTRVLDALIELSSDEDRAAKVLKLSERQRAEIAVNAALGTSATMPAIDRYTGVLFDALDAASLDRAARAWLGEHVAIHSAPFGLVGSLEGIPAYRMAAGVSIPELGPLKRLWAASVTSALISDGAPFVLDLRSEAYVALGPVPAQVQSRYVRVVSPGADGAVRALNHFNKHAKGDLTRRLATSRPVISSAEEFLAWAADSGVELRKNGADWDLVTHA